MSRSTGERMAMSGFCAFPSAESHQWCRKDGCTCSCHT